MLGNSGLLSGSCILKYNLNYHVQYMLMGNLIHVLQPGEMGWMRQNFLKLNDEKTEFLLFGSRQQFQRFLFHLLQLVTRR